MEKEIRLGDRVRDKVTGLVGIATARCSYLNGCDHVGIQPPAKDGKIPAVQWVDIPQIEVITEEKRYVAARDYELSGGPAPHPTR